ncbi:MAG: DNA repair protein RecO [Candidatus Margulisiibacteriota bacterium]
MKETLAIIFNTRPILEKDILVEMFTKDLGRIHAFAKFAQSNKPRFGGLLNTFNCVKVGVLERNGSFTLRHIQRVDTFQYLKKNYTALSTAYNMLDIVRAVTQLNIENEGLFTILNDALSHINSVKNQTDVLQIFYYAILKNEGLVTSAMNLNEMDYKKMIESYSGIKLKDKL